MRQLVAVVFFGGTLFFGFSGLQMVY